MPVLAPIVKRPRETAVSETVLEQSRAPVAARDADASLPRYLTTPDEAAEQQSTRKQRERLANTPGITATAEAGGQLRGTDANQGAADQRRAEALSPDREDAAKRDTGREKAQGGKKAEQKEAPAAKKDSKEGEGEKAKGGAAEEESGGDKQAATGADLTEKAPEPLPVPPPAELGGIIPRVIPLPPVMSRERSLDILARTGMRPEAHHASIRRRLDSIAERARGLQDDIVREARLAGLAAVAAFNAKADGVPGMTVAAEEGVRAAYAGARARVKNQAGEALVRLEAENKESGAKLDASSLTMQQQLQRVLASGSPAIMHLHTEQLGIVDKLLDEFAGKFRKDLAKKETAIRNSEARSVSDSAAAQETRVQFPWEIPRAEVTPVRLEAETRAWPVRAGQMADDVKRSIELNATQILAQHDTFSLIILQLVNPAAVQLKEVTAHEQGEVGGARTKTVDRVATDYERAVNTVNQFQERAIKQLDAGEQGAVKEIRAIGRRLEADIRMRGNNLELGAAETARELAEAYRVQMAGVNESIDVENFLDMRQVEPVLAGAEKRFDEMYGQQSASLRATVDEAMAAADAAIQAQSRAAEEIADNSAAEAWKIADAQVDAITNASAAFARAVKAPAESVTGVASPYTATASEALGQRPEQVRKAVQQMVAGTRKTLDETFKSEDARLEDTVKNLKAHLTSALVADGWGKISDLNDRIQRAYNAMVGLGTNERQLFGALRGLTQLQGKLMEVIWRNRFPPQRNPITGEDMLVDLRAWLDDELSGDEKRAAFAYLEGRTEQGAIFELNSAMRWYGDDEEQIEEVLRDLQQEPPKGGHIETLKNTEGWKETHERLQSNLGGTDLNVTNALLAGNRYRADALRLRERIEEARRRGDHDKVHKLLEGIPPAELAEIRREFAAAERGLGPGLEAGKGISDKEARDTLVEFVTRDRQVIDPHSARYGGQPQIRTMSITGANRSLAVALASRTWDPLRQREGFESQVAVRAAQMEVEVGRKGDKNLAKLQRGFEHDQDAETNEALKSPNEEVRKEAERRRTEARAVRMAAMRRFAEQHAGRPLPKDDDVTQYAAGVVGNLFTSAEGKQFGTSIVKEGYADPAAAMRLAVEGRGTDEDLIKRTLSRMDRDQIKKMKEEYRTRYKEDLDQRLGTNQPKRDERTALAAMAVSPLLGAALLAKPGGELSGDERLEVELLMLGRPRNDRERFELEMARTEQQRTETGAAGQALMKGSLDEHLMNDSNRRMIEIVDRAGGIDKAFDPKTGRFIGSSPTRDAAGRLQPSQEEAWTFGEELKWNQFGAEAYQAGIDRMTNFLATALAVIAAVVVTILIPGVGGAIAGAIIGGLLSMATKAALKGGRYGWEEAAVDLAVTAVDAVTAGLTRGLGQALRGAGTAAKGAAAAGRRSIAVFGGLAARGRTGKALAYVASEGIENFVGSVPSAFTANVLNDQNWKGGSPFENILKGTFIEAGISTGVGLGMGATMDAASTAFGAVRGSLRERALRTQLMASVPTDLRPGLANVPILELPAKHFDQLTGSKSGQAVTIFTPDGPVIYMREGASPRVLREEGIHLMQAKEVEWQGRIADLSETNLARWHEMSLGEQLALYRTKIDVEIDAQQRLLLDLGDELALAGPLSSISLRRRVREAEITLDNLRRRKVEVESYTPDRVQKIVDSGDAPPEFLDQPPRLFTKPPRGKASKKAGDVEVKGLDENTRVRKLPTSEASPDRSPLSGREDVTGTVVQIGKRWVEPNGREYRLVGVVDENGNLTHVRQEIRSEHEGNPWVQRGSESQKRGEIAEEASRHMSAASKERGWTTKAMESQWDASGRGFDEVLFDFRTENGVVVARVRVVEVKDYPGRYVPLESFTAIRPQSKKGSLQKNVEFTKAHLRKNGTKPPPDGLGLTEEQVAAALRAFKDGHVELEIRHTPGTLIGERDAGTVVKQLEREWKKAGFGKRREPGQQADVEGQPRVVEIGEPHMRAARSGKNPRARSSDAPEPDATVGALRKELLSGATPRMRRALDGVRILELSPKDFRKLTDSSTAQAVTLLTDEGPVIYFKRGANPRVLREERIHVMQLSDPRFKGRIHKLSESNLARWDEMDIREQLELYRLKLELEIDAHEQLLLQLPHEIREATGHAKRRLQAQLAETQVTLDNLRRRQKEVAALKPARIERMDSNPDTRPDYLKEKPRLFAKQAGGETRETTPPRGEAETAERPGAELDRLINRRRRLEREIEESHQRERLARVSGNADRAGNIAAGRARRLSDLTRVGDEIDAEVERLLPELAKMLNLDIAGLIAAIQQSAEAKKAGRRLDAIDVLDSLRNRHREGRPPRFGNLEGVISEEAIEINVVALEEMRSIISAIKPDSVLAVQRGGSFLAEALECGQSDFPPVHSVDKHEEIGADGTVTTYRVPKLEEKILELIRPPSNQSTFVIVDFMMGRGFEGELRKMIAKVTAQYPHVTIRPLWMRETHGYERLTSKITREDLEEGVAFVGTVRIRARTAEVGGAEQVVTRVKFRRESLGVLPPAEGDLVNTPVIDRSQVPATVVLGDDMAAVFDPGSDTPIRIIDRNGRIVQEIRLPATDPVTGERLETVRAVMIRVVQGHFTRNVLLK